MVKSSELLRSMPGLIAVRRKPCWKPIDFYCRGRHHDHGKTVDSVLIEPVHIGVGSVIRNTIIGPNVSISAGCVVTDSIIKDSIINSGSVVQSVILSHSILGDAVRLSGAPKTLNIGDNSLVDLGE